MLGYATEMKTDIVVPDRVNLTVCPGRLVHKKQGCTKNGIMKFTAMGIHFKDDYA